MSLTPAYVISNMTKLKKRSISTLSAEECVQGALGELGYELSTAGHWR